MTPRKRSAGRNSWPDNLYPNRDGFKYRHPITRRETFMGRDKSKAFAAAKKLNAMLMPGNDLVDRVMGSRETVADAIATFRRDEVPVRGWAPKTAEVYESVIRRIDMGLGSYQTADVTVKVCAEFIRSVTQSARARQQFRLVLGWVMSVAVQEGWIDANPVLATRRFHHERKRARLTKEMYSAIWEKGEPWLRLAMDLSLITLLRRDDVVSLKFSDIRDSALWVVPQKTEGSSSVKLKIGIGEQLANLLSQARDHVLSPYIVHRLPDRARPSDKRAAARLHHTQVMPEQLTRAFQTAREAAGITGDSPPSFHEIRSLGGALLTESGWTIDQVQALMGHSSSAMTEHYLEGHDVPWQEVQAGSVLLS